MADQKHDDAWAVRVLDAWVAQRGRYSWEVNRNRDRYHVSTRDGNEGCDFEPDQPTAAEARIAAASALVAANPSLEAVRP